MIAISPLLAVAVFQAVPCEYVIDFGAEAAPFEYRMVITCVARDGTDLDLPVTFTANTDPKGNRDDMVHFLRRNNWETRLGPGNSVVVTQTIKGKSPVRSVTIRSEKLIPVTVRWSPVKPPEKK
jgi:hypothetical protein